jgi:hypothetical protein
VKQKSLYSVESYWLAKEWIATAVCLKWMSNSAYYIENLFHSSIYWFLIFWFIEIHLRTEIFVCHEDFFFWLNHLRLSLSLRFDLIRIAYSFSNSLIFRQFRKSVDLNKIISIEWLQNDSMRSQQIDEKLTIRIVSNKQMRFEVESFMHKESNDDVVR